MFKRIQKKTGTTRTREDDEEPEAQVEDTIVKTRKPLAQ